MNKFGGKTMTNTLMGPKVVKAPKPIDDDDEGELEIDFGGSKQKKL